MAVLCVYVVLDAFEAMNHVDFLLQNPFTSLKQEDKLHIKSLGPHQPKDISFSCFDGKVNRHFKTSLYESVKWLTISVEKKRLFCLFVSSLSGPILVLSCNVSSPSFSSRAAPEFSNLTVRSV